jgi:two-component system, chemotaxis family, chemotaxis protein CheY
MRKLLIVDDSNIIRGKIARSLAQFNVKIVGLVANGRDAVAKFEAVHPDIVTMDLTMPEMDGLECIRAIVRIDAKVRILVVSALADKATAIRALKEGAQGFLCKPFTEDELTEAMSELIGETTT